MKLNSKEDEYGDSQESQDAGGYGDNLSYIKDIHANIPPKYQQNQQNPSVNPVISSLTELIQREIGVTNEFQCRLSHREGEEYVVLECTRK